MLLISLRISLAAGEMRDAYPKLIPPSYKDEIIDAGGTLLNVWISFLRGQLSLMVLMGFLTYLLNLLLGTPYPLFLGVLAGVLEIIPNLGPVLATIPAVIFALVLGSSQSGGQQPGICDYCYFGLYHAQHAGKSGDRAQITWRCSKPAAIGGYCRMRDRRRGLWIAGCIPGYTGNFIE